MSFTTHNLGDAVLLAVRASSQTLTITGITHAGISSWTQLATYIDGTNNETQWIYMGIVTVVTTATLSVDFSTYPGVAIDLAGLELTAGSSNVTWNLLGAATNGAAASDSITFPAINPKVSNAVYFGFTYLGGTGTAGSTAGYTYTKLTSGNFVVYNTDTANATQAPTMTQVGSAPPPTGKGYLWIGPCWAPSYADSITIAADIGLTPAQSVIIGPVFTGYEGITGSPAFGKTIFAEGNFNSGTTASWTASANACISHGINIIRLSWEFNTAFPANNSGWWPNNPSGFINIWKNCYNAYSAAAVAAGKPANWFSFIWNPDKGPTGTDTALVLEFYPGAAYMGNPGVVGIDLYVGNTPAGKTGAALFNGYNTALDWNPAAVVALANEHGHDIAAPEWSNRIKWNDGLTDDGPYMTACVEWAANFVTASTGDQNAYLGMWVDNYPDNNPWNFVSGPQSVAAVSALVTQYKASGVITAG